MFFSCGVIALAVWHRPRSACLCPRAIIRLYLLCVVYELRFLKYYESFVLLITNLVVAASVVYKRLGSHV